MDKRSRNQLIEYFQNQMLSGIVYESITMARSVASSIIGQPIRPGTPEAKQLDEAIECACVLAAKAIIRAGGTPSETYDALVNLYERQPSLSVRTSTSVLQQAYSTPLPIGYLAAKLAQIDETKTVFEPAGGNGALLLLANPALVNVNEINPERAEALRSQGFEVTINDATNYLPSARHDVVIMNPPFGAVPGQDGASISWVVEGGPKPYRTTQIDRAIALSALKAMKDDGRAVLIIGGKMGSDTERSNRYNSQQNRAFFYTLYQNYNVTKHISIDGNLYRRQGAGFPIDLIVIEGRGKSSLRLPAADVPPIYRTFENLKELLPDEPKRTVQQPQSLDTTSLRAFESDRILGSSESTQEQNSDRNLYRIPRTPRSQSRANDPPIPRTIKQRNNLPQRTISHAAFRVFWNWELSGWICYHGYRSVIRS